MSPLRLVKMLCWNKYCYDELLGVLVTGLEKGP